MTAHAYLRAADCRIDELAALVDTVTDPTDYPLASETVREVLVYDAGRLGEAAARDERATLAELARALADGPGVFAIRGAFADTAAVDRVTEAFDRMIAEEEAEGGGGDHFAAPGANSRVWNALEKLAVADPEAFVDYYANGAIALASTAWLGPGYQITSQVNVVRPGGKAQEPHRDYHLGFMTDELAERFPRHVHRLSPALTLQGAVAHSDMPIESGPTMLLPHSQRWDAGYVAWRREDVKTLFAERRVQLPLAKGDALFFNPAILHGAGTNTSTDVQRCANLLQVSSAFGRAMETVDRARTVSRVYPALRARRRAGADAGGIGRAVAAAAEGYPFPTNLDRDRPVGSLTPVTQAELVLRALEEDWDEDRLVEALQDQAERRRTHDDRAAVPALARRGAA